MVFSQETGVLVFIAICQITTILAKSNISDFVGWKLGHICTRFPALGLTKVQSGFQLGCVPFTAGVLFFSLGCLSL